MALHPVSGFGMFIIAIATPIMTGQAGAAVSYKYTDLGLGTAYDINNNGEVHEMMIAQLGLLFFL